jgi:hypothetical protein
LLILIDRFWALAIQAWKQPTRRFENKRELSVLKAPPSTNWYPGTQYMIPEVL